MPAGAAADPEVAEEARGAYRVESEWKLSVPDAELEPLRTYLQRRYGAGPGSLLPELGAGFTASFSDEHFVDRYFDTPGLDVLKAEGGVRHRARRNLGDASTDRKHGRELVQLKLRRPGDRSLNRTEIKFKVDPPGSRKSDLDRHPLIGLVDRDQQRALIDTAKRHGFDAERMRPMLTIEQRRWRVYVARDGQPFSTLTLDEVRSEHVVTVTFVELEIELNEVAYTDAGGAQREAMQAVSTRMAQDVLAAFPGVKQDQTPKYNKVHDAFAARVPAFDTLLVHGDTLRAGLLLGAPLLIALVVAIVQKARARKAPARTL